MLQGAEGSARGLIPRRTWVVLWADHARHPRDSTKGIAFDKGRDNPRALFGAQLIHAFKLAFMLEWSSLI